jgi:hypothetical protein
MMHTVSDLELEIARHKREVEELERKLEVLRQESSTHVLAREFHSILCTHNHTDGCSWFYETKQGMDDWTGYAHDEYLKKAILLYCWCYDHGVSTTNALNLLKLFR